MTGLPTSYTDEVCSENIFLPAASYHLYLDQCELPAKAVAGLLKERGTESVSESGVLSLRQT